MIQFQCVSGLTFRVRAFDTGVGLYDSQDKAIVHFSWPEWQRITSYAATVQAKCGNDSGTAFGKRLSE